MPYFIIIFVFIIFPAHAQMGVDSGIRKPNYVQVAQADYIPELSDTTSWVDNPTYSSTGPLGDLNSVSSDDAEKTQEVMEDTKLNQVQTPNKPKTPNISAPRVSAPQQSKTRKIVKKNTPLKIERAINDERLDDGYVQNLVKDNFNLVPKIE